MSAYQYRAACTDGRVLSGSVTARSPAEASRQLLQQGLFPLAIAPGAGRSRRPSKPPVRDLAIMFRSIATLLQAGLPLERALAATEPIVPPGLRLAVSRARERLTEGEPLAISLGGSESPIPEAAISLLRAGERAGRLAQALDVVAVAMEREADLRHRVQHALAYPAILAVSGAISIGVITTVVVPRFAAMLAEVGHELPPSTSLLLASSAFLAQWWLAILAASTGAALLFRVWLNSPRGRLLWHQWLLTLPVVGDIRASLGATRSLVALAASLEAGMPLVAALGTAGEAANDVALSSRLAATADLLLQGAPLARSLEATRALPQTAVQLLGIGESSGQLTAMADRASRMLGTDLERKLDSLVRLLEPALIVAFGGLIAVVAGSLLQAVYSLRPAGI